MPTSRFRALAASLTLAIASTAVALLAGEGVVRLAMPQDVGSVVNIYAQDDALQYRYLPNARARQSSPEFDVDIVTNALGFRDDEIDPVKPAGTCRVMVVGDSFSVGHGVAVTEGYASRLESLLNARPDTSSLARWDVINASVSGYHLYHYGRSIEIHAARLGVDLALIGFYVGNDFGAHDATARRIVRNGYLGRYERRGDDDAELSAGERARRALQPLREWLGTRSHLYVLVVRAAYPVLVRAGLAGEEFTFDFRIYRREPDERTGRRFAGTPPLLADAARAARDAGAGLLVAVIPDRHQVEDSSWGPAVAAAGLAPAAVDPAAPNVRLAAMLAAAAIPAVDLLPAFREQSAAGLYFPHDGHWNARGHALAAERIADRVAALAVDGTAAAGAPLRCLAGG